MESPYPSKPIDPEPVWGEGEAPWQSANRHAGSGVVNLRGEPLSRHARRRLIAEGRKR